MTALQQVNQTCNEECVLQNRARHEYAARCIQNSNAYKFNKRHISIKLHACFK